MPSPPQILKQVVMVARKWARSRARYRKLLDSKSATKKTLEKAKERLLKDTDSLESAVIELEKVFRNIKSQGGTRGTIPWKEIFSVISIGAGALEKAMHPGAPPEMGPKIIDVECESRNVD